MFRRPILTFKRPETIQVADKPLNLGGKIELVSTDILEKRLNTTINESIYLDPKLKLSELKFQESINGSLSSKALKKQIESLITTPRDDLVLCNMGKVGYGVFAAKDIPANSVIGIYAGTITKEPSSSDEHALIYYGSDFVFSHSSFRCLASYFQHLPEIPKTKDAKTYVKIMQQYGIEVSEKHYRMNMDMFNIEFKSNVKNNVATQNMRTEYLNFSGIPIIAMVTNQLIKKHAQLGYPYGVEFWLESNFLPEYFDNNGNIIPHHDFKRLFGTLKIADCSYLGEYKPLIDQLDKNNLVIELVDRNGKKHSLPAEEVKKQLTQLNALNSDEKSHSHNTFKLLISLHELPVTIKLTDQNGKMIDKFSESVDSVSFHELRKALGAGVIKKISLSQYEINTQWMFQVHTYNPLGIAQLAKIFGISQNELTKIITPNENIEEKLCLAALKM